MKKPALVTIVLEDGKEIRVHIFKELAPKTAANFIELAKNGFYDGLCFHRVIDKFMIQGGGYECKDGELVLKPAAPVEGEFLSNKFNNPVKHEAGVISMARTQDKNSASSQFFICVEDCAYLDGNYAAFGRVADEQSLETARSISKVKTGKWMAYDDVPVAPVVIKKTIVFDD